MKQVVLVATLVASLAAAAVVSGQTAPAAGSSLGSITLAKRVMADGQPLAAGTYQVRLSADVPKPGAGQTAEAERYVEFVRGGKVVGREVASVVSNAEIASIVDGPRPANGGSRVDTLKGDDYVRVWSQSGRHALHHPHASRSIVTIAQFTVDDSELTIREARTPLTRLRAFLRTPFTSWPLSNRKL